MNSYVFLIGALSDFDSAEELRNLYLKGELKAGCGRNFALYEFSLPDVPVMADGTYKGRDIAALVGRGLAFTEDWCREGTISFLL